MYTVLCCCCCVTKLSKIQKSTTNVFWFAANVCLKFFFKWTRMLSFFDSLLVLSLLTLILCLVLPWLHYFSFFRASSPQKSTLASTRSLDDDSSFWWTSVEANHNFFFKMYEIIQTFFRNRTLTANLPNNCKQTSNILTKEEILAKTKLQTQVSF